MFLDLNEEVNIILLPGPGVLTVEEDTYKYGEEQASQQQTTLWGLIGIGIILNS